MISWEEYLTTLVKTFRSYYDKLSDEEKSASQLNMTFAKPCQIEFFSFEKDGQMMVVTFKSDHPDEVIVHDHAKKTLTSISKANLPYKKKLKNYVKDMSGITWYSLGDAEGVYVFGDLKSQYPSPETYARKRFEDVRSHALESLRSQKRVVEYGTIEKEIEKIRSNIKRIQDNTLRVNMLNTAQRIDNSLSSVKKLDQHEQRLSTIEEEIGGVRRMIGSTKEFQDFRVFTTDLEELKRSHIHKDVVTTEIRRLDEKVERGLKALNTRIEDLKAIKFWSKRTLLEIALATLAVISTLFATGILKF